MAARGKFPSSVQDRYIVRFPDGMRERIKQVAKANGQSLNAAIVVALEAAYPAPPEADPYVAMIEEAVLKGEQFVADIEASRRKGYTPRPLFEAADAIRARRRAAGQ